MSNMDKFCLNWNGYDTNIRESFRKLREDQRLSDVTLVTDDGQHIQTHKIILSVGSNFFSDIFIKSNHSNMLVYLKGISSDKLETVIDFIYNGEVFITQDQLKLFIETGRELQIKRLDEKLVANALSPMILQKRVHRSRNNDKVLKNRSFPYSVEHFDFEDKKVSTGSGDDNEDTVAKMDEENLQLITNNEPGIQINEIIEKNEGEWRCKICGKTATNSYTIRAHSETHIKGMSYACHICSKTFSNRPGLNTHISGIHSELFSCDICGKNGMNRFAYRKHLRIKHK